MKAEFIPEKDSKTNTNCVIVTSDATVFYDQSGYGRIEKSGKLLLECVEALYLISRGKIVIDDFSFDDILTECAKNTDFVRNYAVYRDIRERGYVITTGPHDYRVFPRGQRPGHGCSRYLIRVVSERNLIDFSVILKEAQSAINMRKLYILAAVDEEHEITYYEVRIQKLQECASNKLENMNLNNPVQGYNAGVTAYILNDEHMSVYDMMKSRWIGTLLDGKRIFLSPTETAWMLETGQLKLDKYTNLEEYVADVSKQDTEFIEKLTVYKHLRSLGYFPRTGYKYGHHFRVYINQGSHSEMLVHAYSHDTTLPMSVISRSVRLAHSVKKKMLFASINDTMISYIEFARVKL